MTLKIKPSTSLQRKQLFIETLFNTTDKVTKISPHSVNAGIAGGISKISGKSEKDVILALSQLFPEVATGLQLEETAKNFGVSGRFGTSKSSTFLYIAGEEGTTYTQGVHTFRSQEGIEFELEQASEVIPAMGFMYIKVRSLVEGSQTNVNSLTITTVNPEPLGHLYVINEVQAEGGRDIESDDLLRKRIRQGANILARGTIGMLEQLFMSINENVLECFYQGVSSTGKIRIAVATQNGIDLSTPQLEELLDLSSRYFSLTDYRPYGTSFIGVELVNVDYFPIDISYRIDYTGSLDEIRRKTLVNISKYLDFRYFDTTKELVEWDELLQIAKNIEGVKYIPDQFFTPRTDLFVGIHKLPRVRGFRLLDLQGEIIEDLSGNLSPLFYPNNPDFSYQRTVLNR